MKKIAFLLFIFITLESSPKIKTIQVENTVFEIKNKVKINLNHHYEGEVKNFIRGMLYRESDDLYNVKYVNYLEEDVGKLKKISDYSGILKKTSSGLIPMRANTIIGFSFPDFSNITLSKGLVWESASSEYFDLSVWGLDEIISLPTQVFYNCTDVTDNKITIKANIYFNYLTNLKSLKSMTPVKIIGYQNAEFFLDNNKKFKGFIKNYNYTFLLKNRDIYDFYGEELCEAKDETDFKFKDKNSIEHVAEKSLKIQNIPYSINDNKIAIQLDELYFDIGKAAIKSENINKLNSLISFIKNINDKIIISIEGHTDNTGTDQFNRILSRMRAKSVFDKIFPRVDNRNVLISYIGYADKKPVASNLTEDGRRQNRRVEIIIIPE